MNKTYIREMGIYISQPKEENDIKCKRCGGKDMYVETKDISHIGLYCTKCKRWVKWLNKREKTILFRQ